MPWPQINDDEVLDPDQCEDALALGEGDAAARVDRQHPGAVRLELAVPVRVERVHLRQRGPRADVVPAALERYGKELRLPFHDPFVHRDARQRAIDAPVLLCPALELVEAGNPLRQLRKVASYLTLEELAAKDEVARIPQVPTAVDVPLRGRCVGLLLETNDA